MLKLHFCSNSRAQRVLWLLEELKIEYNLNKIKFHPSELKSEEHRNRHPLGRVPVLEDGDITIYESGAIIEYIIARHSNGNFKPKIEERKGSNFNRTNLPHLLLHFFYKKQESNVLNLFLSLSR